ncbi:MAG TPA: hypothetical protein VGC70_09915, partial [Burkholderiales bacterium]
MSPQRPQPRLDSNTGAAANPAGIPGGIPEPEPRGYSGNLGLLFSEHATSGCTAIADLNNPAQPRDLTFREL